MSISILFIAVTGLISAGCRTAGAPAATAHPEASLSVTDPHSFARPGDVSVSHLSLDLNVDFERRQLSGTARLDLVNHSGAGQVILDTRELDIHKVTLQPGGAAAAYSLGDPVEFLGRRMSIDITPSTRSVTIEYGTRPAAAALQWLSAEQTAGGSHPFLLTQSEAILARTWIPLQDSPSIRFTWDATVHVPNNLLAVMSASDNPLEKNASGVYHFEMRQPVPSYLMALAVGDLSFRRLSPRSGVYAEPVVVDKAAWEFADTPKMIAAAEKLYGPYRWGRYDILVLPPSFPYGGMENPNLTFATPTVLAGDRSLVSLVAHELAHSWSGNLVTNATWNDFWLNEGFTDYFTSRIMEELYGREYSEMLAILSRQDLDDQIAELGAAHIDDTHLFLNLAGRDPDEGMNDIAYNKGYYFLRMIEEAVGRARWDEFLRTYFDTFAFHSMTTKGFESYLRTHLLVETPGLEARLNIDAWLYGPGVPPNVPVANSAAFSRVDEQLASFRSGASPSALDTHGWNTHQWVHFIRNLPTPLTQSQMAALDSAFHFTSSGNGEILDVWFEQAIHSDYRQAFPAMERFLTSIGRRKFLKPLYTELAKTPAGKEFALAVYRKARPGYHSVSRGTIDQILGVESGG
ncbi:MAG: M1 family metallopeptidase [Acidobacteriota bacterium]